MIESHGISINALPPFQYSLDCPHLNMTKDENNRVIRTDLLNWITEKHGLAPQSLGSKMAVKEAHFLQPFEDGFIVRSSYIDIYLLHALCCVVG